eukprot:4529155-Pleurochrysis_carterae.AAC.2
MGEGGWARQVTAQGSEADSDSAQPRREMKGACEQGKRSQGNSEEKEWAEQRGGLIYSPTTAVPLLRCVGWAAMLAQRFA